MRGVASLILGVAAVVVLVPLLIWDVAPEWFPADAHRVLGALPLALIAVVYFIHQALRRAAPAQYAKAGLVACAFLFWSANQLFPDLPQATLFNDLAIALFVLDLALVMIGWRAEPDPAPERGDRIEPAP